MKPKRPPGLLALILLAILIALGYGTYRVFAIGYEGLNIVCVLILAIAFSRGVWIAQNTSLTWLRDRGELAAILTLYLMAAYITISLFSSSFYIIGSFVAIITLALLMLTMASIYQVITYRTKPPPTT